MQKYKAKVRLAACLLLTGLASIVVNAQETRDTPFMIRGTLSDIAHPPVKLYLIYTEDKEAGWQKTPDSAEVKEGHYTFSGSVADLSQVTIATQLLSPKDMGNLSAHEKISLFLDKGESNITSTGTLDKVTLSGPGTRAQRDYEQAYKPMQEVIDSMRAITTSEAYKTDKKLQAEVMIRVSNLFEPMINTFTAYAKGNPLSPISPYLVYMAAGFPLSDPMVVDSVFHSLPPDRQKGRRAEIIVAKLEKRKQEAVAKNENDEKAAVGNPAKDFSENNTEGHPVSLSSFKGKYVLVDFWASWCGPCRMENPNVVKAYQTYKAKGFEVLGVSLDDETHKDKWLEAIQKDGLSWTQVSDLKGWSNAAAGLYGVAAIPQNVLIDPNGIIIAKNLRGQALQDKLASLFK